MSLTFKRYIIAVLTILFLAALLLVAYNESRRIRIEQKLTPIVTQENKACVECHRQNGPALVMEWEHSLHAKNGVGCIDCHTAQKGEIDAWEHEGVYRFHRRNSRRSRRNRFYRAGT